jgi:CheY-like chemotaxis protein
MRNTPAGLIGLPILVVEDDPASARLLVVVLANEGADVRVARSAEEAVTILREFAARIIIVDLILPRMSGLLLVAQLKADPATSGLTIIAVSVVDGPETERMALAAGCAAYIRKPIDVETFAATIIANLKETI